jgi:glycosyltransferase involved in cell wall biosynthesis
MLISIVIPIYNRAHLLPRVLESIKNQTYKNIEVIVVDDGSGIEVKSQKSKVKSQFEKLIWIEQKNMGAPAARNRGLEEAKGEYVIFWDADVIGENLMLERLYNAMQENNEASYAYCNHISHITYHISKKMSAKKFDKEDLKKNNFIHSTSLIRKSDAIKWDESLKRFQDWDLWLSMSEQGMIGVWVDEYLFTILGGGTMSSWLPRIAYKAPFKWFPFVSILVFKYEEAKKVIIKKHNLSTPVS